MTPRQELLIHDGTSFKTQGRGADFRIVKVEYFPHF